MSQPPFNARRSVRAAALGLAASLAAPVVPAQGQETPGLPNTPAVQGRGQVTLNFVNADIEAVTRAMAAMLDRQFIVDPRVKGTITVYSEQALSVREAYMTYLSSLRGLGFTVVETGGFLKVVPEADAKLQTGTVAVGAPPIRGDQVITQIFRLNYENPNNLVAVLRPLISANNTINSNPASNSLVITDYAENLQRIARIIAALDQPSSSDIEVVQLKNASAADLAPMVQRFAEAGSAGAPGVPAAAAAAGAAAVIADTRSNSLIIRAANPARLAYVRGIIEKLDRPAQGGGPGGNIWVVYLKHADAAKIATVLRAAFASTGSTAGMGTGGLPTVPATPTPTPTSAQQRIDAGGNYNQSAMGQSAAATSPVTPGAGPQTGGFIQADPSTNSLVITAPEPVYRQIRATIDQLDTRRVQVAIESMIVEVVGDNAADFGFQWQGLIGQSGDKYGVVGGTNFGTQGNIIALQSAALGVNSGDGGSAVTPVALLGQGLNIGLIKDFAGTYGLAAIARFLQSQTNTNIVSTPNLITLDNEEAKIVVGQNVPFITGQYTNTGVSTTSPFQTIERKDVGITLRIKPQVGEGGTVRMTIFQEASSVADRLAAGTAQSGPTTNKRAIESTVVVDDGAILVLGGLIEDRYTENKSQIPLLGDIPYLGALFRSESRTKQRTNLMVFLRPVIMRDADAASRHSLDRYDMIRAQQQSAQPRPNPMLPISEAPVLPPARAVDETAAPLSVPPSSPGTNPPRTPAPAASGPEN